MLKIGEFSKLTKVSIRMLHYYDDVGLLKPMKIDAASGYRLYSVSQVSTLQKIIMLRDFKFQVPEMENALMNWSDEDLTKRLKFKIKEREAVILQEKKQIKNIELAIKSIENKKIDVHYNVIVKKVPSQIVISLRKSIPSYYHEGVLWEEIFKYIRNRHINIIKRNDNTIAIFHDNDHKDTEVDVEVCVLVKNIQESKAPFIFKQLDEVETMACMMVRGSYSNIATAYEAFMYWLDEHSHYEMNGPTRQVTHCDHTNEENENDYLTEIQIPITLKNGRSN